MIIHGCNCFNTMGAGIAASVKRRFPAAYKADCATEEGSHHKLGSYTSATVTTSTTNGTDDGRHPHELTIVNAYTQYHWSPRKGGRADYKAIRSVFAKIKSDFSGKRIGYPLIGAGLAGGDWNIISRMIEEELEGENHTLVKFVQQPRRPKVPSLNLTSQYERDIFSAMVSQITDHRLRQVLVIHADETNGSSMNIDDDNETTTKFTKDDFGLICNLLSKDSLDAFYRDDHKNEEKLHNLPTNSQRLIRNAFGREVQNMARKHMVSIITGTFFER